MKSLLQTRSDKPAVNFFSRFASAVALMLIASAPAAVAQIYTFSFAGNSGIDATGTITISGGVATSGSINVVNVPLESLPGTTTASGSLLSLSDGSPISISQSNVRDQNGDVITYDVAAFAPPSDPIFDGTGVCFASGYAGLQSSTPSYDTLVNIWGNGPGSYGMFIGEANPAYLNPDGTPIAGAPHNEIQWVYVFDETGTLTLTPVPEPATLGLVSAGLLGLLALRRRKA
ncbi:MAG TPA: PEP-CTERM sorting domain-containing protein [Verrucomicrobiae bacterium]|nr:PEP-CTERM sorting domain-containing protein [Verrucomicrobiae bacterium]